MRNRPQYFQTSPVSHAFTLVELLVVISIMSLLVSILLPVLSSARVTARNVLCKSNIRMINTGALLFAEENAGVLPGISWWWPYDMGLGVQIKQTLGISSEAWVDLMTCPDIAIAGVTLPTSYGYNPWLYAGPSGSPSHSNEYADIKIGNLRQPDQTLIFCDAVQPVMHNTRYIGDYENPRHTGVVSGAYYIPNIDRVANASFGDGHVEFLRCVEITTGPTADIYFQTDGRVKGALEMLRNPVYPQ